VLILIFTYRRFTFTDLTYVLLWISAVLVTVGGHYIYEKVPVFNWIRDTWGLHRNHYDRFVHITQGITAVILVREILVRKTPLKQGPWLFFITICISLAFSALYELSEFVTAIMIGKSSDAFLGMQGDKWDTQWDMLCNLIGAIFSSLVLARFHDRLMLRSASIESRKRF
jgi:putative membrane protein